MSKNAELQQRRVDAVARGVGNATQLFAVRAENAEIWDADGRRYIDFAGGIGVMNTGHRHPKVMARIQQQLEGVVHSCFQVMPYEPYIELAEELNKRAPIAGKAKTLFITTGAEAVENAVKIARAYTKRPGVIAFGGGYHGRTLLTLGLTGKVAPYKIGFGPFPADIFHARFPHPYHGVTVADTLQDIANLFKYDIEASRVAAIIIEPVIGEGGFVPAPPELMRALRAICDEHGILLIADEVQSGFARTGKLFAFQHGDIVPDICTMAKGLTSSYLPLGVMAVSDRIANHFRENVFWGGLTYNAHPLCLASALAAVNALVEEGMVENAARMGEVMRGHMERLAKKHRCIKEHRNIGLFGTIELRKNSRNERLVPYAGTHPVMPQVGKFLKDNGLFTVLQWSTLMCNPPLCINEAQMAEGFGIIDRALDLLDEVFEG